jgi:hypothetical protein
MARNANASHVNGGGEPPPSTLAGQIVQNLENVQRRQTSQDAKTHLKELLRLILEDPDERTSTQRHSEEEIEENRRLIIVTARACLDSVLERNPFDDAGDLQSDAQQCLSVIQMTIQRYPESLLAPWTKETIINHPRGPLYFWLLPKLITVLTLCEWPDVQGHAFNALKASMKLESRALPLRLGLRPVTRFLQGCVNGTSPILRIA